MRKIFYAAMIVFLINPCHTNMEADSALLGEVPVTVLPVQNIVNEQKLIKEADLRFEVEDLDKMRNTLKQAASKYAGCWFASNISNL